jgi:CheY-like chemotaxis protein
LDSAHQPSKSVPGTVLLVEDNPTDLYVLRMVLERCELGLDLHIARDGEHALRYLEDVAQQKSACPTLVLLDLNVPKVSGIEVLRRLRHASPCNRVPVIVVTSSGETADRAETQRLGANAFFQKPVDLAAYMQLVPLLKSVLEHSEGSDKSQGEC